MKELNPSDQNSAEQNLADKLHRQARSINLGDTPLATVVRRGRQRRDRRRVAVGVVAVAALSGTAIGTIQLLSQPVSRKVVPAVDPGTAEEVPTGTLVDPATGDALTPVNRVESNLTWNIVEPGTTEALGNIIWDNTAVTGQNPPYLAWSTTPGKTANQEFIPTLYRSDDGIHWQAAGGESFAQPEISMRGTGSRNGRLFAYGTAAAAAPIPNGGGGEVVMDVSDDLGATWRHITLPIDLRSLASADGVQSVGFQGDMIAGDAGVVAVGVPTINIDPSLYDANVGYIARREGAILMTYPTCGSDVTASTIQVAGGYSRYPGPAGTAPIPTAVTTTSLAPTPDTGPSDVCSADGTPQQSALIPWSELGVDPNVVGTMFAPRVFVSTDGESFVEGAFPQLPDGYQMGQIDLAATDAGFVASAQLYDQLGPGLAKLYTSTDGLAWTESDMPPGQYNIINVLPDGTVVAFGNDMTGQSLTAVSTDGVEWSAMSLSSMLDSSDGASAQLNVGMSSAGPGGITVVAGIHVDAAVEAGGLSIEKDGVRLTMMESRYQSLVAIDIATGEMLARFDGQTPPDANAILGYDEQGGYRLLDEDGSVRVRFTDADVQSFYDQQNLYPPKAVILHSTDGVNWSRDDIEPLAGFDTYGATRIQVTESNVLVSLTDTSSRDSDGLPRAVVLVGTAKS